MRKQSHSLSRYKSKRFSISRKIKLFSGSKSFNLFLYLIISSILIPSCEEGDIPSLEYLAYDFSIQVDDQLIAGLQNGDLTSLLQAYSSQENPTIFGTITLNEELELLSDVDTRTSCCRRVYLEADGEYFLTKNGMSNRASLTVLSLIQKTEDNFRYNYSTSPLLLPDNGKAVTLELRVGLPNSTNTTGDVVVSGSIQLRPETVVMPVHVHRFVNPSETSEQKRIAEENIISAFAFPKQLVKSPLVQNDQLEGRIKTYLETDLLNTEHFFVDDIWEQANIQFKLSSYENITQQDNLESILLNFEEAAEVRNDCDPSVQDNVRFYEYHRDRLGQVGIHIYLGGRLDGISISLNETPGLTCSQLDLGFQFGRVGTWILIDEEMVAERPTVITHELGHFLGLRHFNPDNPDELPAGANVEGYVMDPDCDGELLTDTQIERTRIIACEFMSRWGLSSHGCD